MGVVRMANEHLASMFSSATYAEPPAFGDPPLSSGTGTGMDGGIYVSGPSGKR